MTSPSQTGNHAAAATRRNDGWSAGIFPSRLKGAALFAVALFVFSNIPDYFLGRELFMKMLYVKLAGAAVFAGLFAMARAGRTDAYYIKLTLAQVAAASAVTGVNMGLSGGVHSTWALAPGLVILVTGLLMPLPAWVMIAAGLICFTAYGLAAFAVTSVPVDARTVTAHFFYYAAFTAISSASAHLQSGFFKSQRERTERIKTLARELEIKNADLVMQTQRAMEASRLKSEFLANISHELRTPLTSIIGFSSLLSKGMGEGDERTMLLKISETGSHLLATINDIIELSRIEAGIVEISRVPCGACSIIDGTANSVRQSARKKNIEIDVNCPADSPSAMMDPVMIGLATSKLLENAVKFSPPGGRVAIGCKTSGSFIEIFVEDAGKGLSGPERGVIFESFRQADGSSSRRHGGLGIGLTLARKIVILHGGMIGVENMPGGGPRFTISIPMGG